MRRPRLIDPGFSGIRKEMAAIGVDPMGIDIMEEKSRLHLIRLDDVDLRAAMILKQDMLSLGGDAALCREAAGLKVSSTPVLLMGTVRQIRRLVSKLDGQPFQLAQLSRSVQELLDTIDRDSRYVVGEKDLLSGGKKGIVGILNVSPDSFSDGGRYAQRDSQVSRGIEMAAQGADIIDVGGESTRPGARPVSTKEELERVIPVIKDLVSEGVKNISIDTSKSEVAERALREGASIVNDISAMTFDPCMVSVCAASQASVILMHTRGRPETMQKELHYDDLMGEVCSHLEEAMELAVKAGIPTERICLDPGIGFGKTPDHNLELISRIGELRSLGTAVMVGASRKSFIGHVTGAEVENRMPGSIGAAAAAVISGADMVRVHDVAETLQALAVITCMKGSVPC